VVFVSVIYFFDHLDLFRISDFGFRISYLSGILALRQNYPIRLLIADDVGVGKTIEAAIILKELLERRDVKSFAVITPPHLCEQWQSVSPVT
jgi:SNF2 family DNA or RNA helicase